MESKRAAAGLSWWLCHNRFETHLDPFVALIRLLTRLLAASGLIKQKCPQTVVILREAFLSKCYRVAIM